MSSKEKTYREHAVVKPAAGRIGAEISGIPLSGDLDAGTVAFIREALLKHKVVFFRDQHQLDDRGHEGFAQLLGEPVKHPTVPSKEGTGYILELHSERGERANSWHTDVTFEAAYPKFSILRGVEIPEAGGDTVWANTASAYERLPSALRGLADQLWAIHTNDYDYTAQRYNVSAAGIQKHERVFTSTLIETEHPVVHVHPETGERHLLLGHFVKKFVGYSTADSNQLFALLQRHVTQLENTVRWRWKSGDVVVWDNRATQHYAVNDYGDAVRVVRRITIAGDVPVSLDGRRSTTTVREKRV